MIRHTSFLVKQHKTDTINPCNEFNVCAVYNQIANISGMLDCGSGNITKIQLVIPSNMARFVAAFNSFLKKEKKSYNTKINSGIS